MLAATDWTQVFLGLMTLVGTTVTAVLAFFLAKASKRTEEATIKTVEQVELIHEAVNSERTLTTDEIKRLREELRSISAEKAVLKDREATHADAVQQKTIEVLTGVIRDSGKETVTKINGNHLPRTEEVQTAANTIVDALTTVTEKTGEVVVDDLTQVIEKKDQPTNEPKTP